MLTIINLHTKIIEVCQKKNTGSFFIITIDNKGCRLTVESGVVTSLSSGRQMWDSFVRVFNDLSIKSYAFRENLILPMPSGANITSSRLFLKTLKYQNERLSDTDLSISTMPENSTHQHTNHAYLLQNKHNYATNNYVAGSLLLFMGLTFFWVNQQNSERKLTQVSTLNHVNQLPLAEPPNWLDNTAEKNTVQSGKPPQAIQLELPKPISLDKKIIHISQFPVRNGYLSSKFGMRKDPFNGKRGMHEGIDIAARLGSIINPVGEGEVIFVGHKSGYGKTIEIRHGKTIVTRYAHVKKILVKKGQKVSKTDSIAKVGNTGRSTGPHLHLEVAINGQPVNPQIFLVETLARK